MDFVPHSFITLTQFATPQKIRVPDISGTIHFEMWKNSVSLWENLLPDSFKIYMKWIIPLLVFINFVLL